MTYFVYVYKFGLDIICIPHKSRLFEKNESALLIVDPYKRGWAQAEREAAGVRTWSSGVVIDISGSLVYNSIADRQDLPQTSKIVKIFRQQFRQTHTI